ncbi:hypothetical protein [Bacteroides sp. 224]|uniref:hypothetical protein n=1 Tax=Bacteroides sp. 224 TaxID=2302936 RepID=UPI0013D8C487|nr:hypothetical protein [Bacteroides sp. 224]NDV64145.1 hypothetical protein [Bacteroides sp. 224]
MEKESKVEKILIKTSKVISGVFTPFIIPSAAFLFLFLFSYLRIMPLQYKLVVLGIVYCFTVLLPVVVIFVYGRINGLSLQELSDRKKRLIPYLLAIISYVFCTVMMYRLNIPSYMTGIILTSLIVMVVFTIINFKWKLSAHLGGMGIAVGCIVSFSALFGYNPVWWLSLIILITGLVGSARIILNQHSLSETLSGFTVGLICSLLVLHPACNFYFRYLLF